MKLFKLPESKAKIRDISAKVWKRASGDPTHPDNASDPDWQSGYLLGSFTEQREAVDDITPEWIKRGKPNGREQYDNTVSERQKIASWRAWKAGYWAGRYSKL